MRIQPYECQVICGDCNVYLYSVDAEDIVCPYMQDGLCKFEEV